MIFTDRRLTVAGIIMYNATLTSSFRQFILLLGKDIRRLNDVTGMFYACVEQLREIRLE